MSLAARCPACATVFRVVQDQLRVSEGWVRCGRCAEVFNAIENLVDLEADAAARPAARAPRTDRVLEDLARFSPAGATPAPVSAPEPVPAPPVEATVAMASTAPAAAVGADGEAAMAGAARAAAPAAPEFVRRADQAARWRHPGVRLLLLLLSIVGAAGLAAQVAVEYRELVAAHWPPARPLLEQLCAPLACRVEAPHAIDSLVVESSGLVRAEGSANYRLSVVLRNRAPIAVSTPAIDLTLTDSQGAVIARRVLRTVELGAAQQSLQPRADLSMQATLAATERAISGYTIEIFYP